jgi:hypothetical protein
MAPAFVRSRRDSSARRTDSRQLSSNLIFRLGEKCRTIATHQDSVAFPEMSGLAGPWLAETRFNP